MLNLSFCVISEKDLKTTAKQISYRDALITDMKEVVDEFYSEMSVKISSITKDQKREIRYIKNKMKPATPSSRSVKHFKQSSEYTLNSNLTISSWASEKQYELNKQRFQLVSEGRSEQPLQQWHSSDVDIKCDVHKRRETWGILMPSQEKKAVHIRVCSIWNSNKIY